MNYLRCSLSFLIIFLSFYAQSATIVVTSNLDSGAGSLRDAISNANSGDIIRFSPILISSGSDSVVLNSSISFSKSIKIVGLYTNTDTLFISGGGSNRIFSIDSTTNVYLDSLVLINGYSTGNGGAISLTESDSLFVSNSVIRSNQALINGGAIYFHNIYSAQDREIHIQIENSHFSYNSANTNGGAISISSMNYYVAAGLGSYNETGITILNSILRNNSTLGNGGSIYIYSKNINSIWLKNSEISNNSAILNGGGMYGYSGLASGSLDVCNVYFYIDSSLITENTSNQDGGGLYLSSDGNSTIYLDYSELSNNIATGNGGGYYCESVGRGSTDQARVNSKYSKIINNTAVNGGGGCSFNSAKGSSYMFFDNSTISGNTASGDGGGIYSRDDFSTAGTGLYAKITNSSFFSNTATNNGGAFCGLSKEDLLIKIFTSTFTKNTANNGGAIYSVSSSRRSDPEINNSTISNNSAVISGGGIYSTSAISSWYDFEVESSIIAFNGANNIFTNSTRTINSSGNNILSDTSIIGSVSSDHLGVTAVSLNLDTLNFNGGVTKTLLPLKPSIAIDNGTSPAIQYPDTIAFAQNGFIVNVSDIGAAETGLRFNLDSVCNGSYVSPSGSIITMNIGTYYDTIKSSLGLDSLIYTIDLKDSRSFSNIFDTVCSVNGLLFGGSILKVSGQYFDTLSNILGCDSMIELSLLVKTVDKTLTQSGFTLIANETAASYQWIDYTTKNVIAGATNQSYTDTTGGRFAVLLTKNGCTDTSNNMAIYTSCNAKFHPTQTVPGQVVILDSTFGNNLQYTWYFGDGDSSVSYMPTHNYITHGTYNLCLKILDVVTGCTDYYCDSITVDSTGVLRGAFTLTVIRNIAGVKEETKEYKLLIYPNPANDYATIDFGNENVSAKINIFDVTGKSVKSIDIYDESQYRLSTSSLSPGSYFVRILIGEQLKILKLIKN